MKTFQQFQEKSKTKEKEARIDAMKPKELEKEFGKQGAKDILIKRKKKATKASDKRSKEMHRNPTSEI